MKRSILFIVNPVSGIGKQKKIENVIEKFLDHKTLDYSVRYTEYSHHGKILAREAVEQGCFDAIVAVGGDGSVNDVATSLKGTDIAMGIIPCGSGNGLARNLHIPLTPSHAVEILNKYNVATIDTITVSNNPEKDEEIKNYIIASIAGVGFDALVARRMQEAKLRGLQAYARIILNDYPTYKEQVYKMKIDDREVERKAWFISIANSNQFGYNTAIAPLAKLDDGLIDICIVDKIPLIHLPMTAPLLYLNHFELSQHVEMYKARKVTIYNNEDEWVNIDGEGEFMGKELHFRSSNRSLKVLVP